MHNRKRSLFCFAIVTEGERWLIDSGKRLSLRWIFLCEFSNLNRFKDTKSGFDRAVLKQFWNVIVQGEVSCNFFLMNRVRFIHRDHSKSWPAWMIPEKLNEQTRRGQTKSINQLPLSSQEFWVASTWIDEFQQKVFNSSAAHQSRANELNYEVLKWFNVSSDSRNLKVMSRDGDSCKSLSQHG